MATAASGRIVLDRVDTVPHVRSEGLFLRLLRTKNLESERGTVGELTLKVALTQIMKRFEFKHPPLHCHVLPWLGEGVGGGGGAPGAWCDSYSAIRFVKNKSKESVHIVR